MDANGTVSVCAEGEAAITATTEDGGKTDTCAVTVRSNGPGSSNTFTITNTGEWNSSIDAIKDGGDNLSYTLVINDEMSVPGTTGNTFGGGTGVSVTVQGSGALTLESAGGIFSLGAGQTLTLGETGDPTLQGRGNIQNNAPLVSGNGGTFTKSGGSISNNSSKSGNGTQVYYDVTPPEYRNNNLGEDDDISTDDLETNWEI